MMKQKILFVGLGNMGNPMAANLIKAGYPVQVFDLVRDKADNLIAMGATWAGDIQQGSRQADLVIASLPGPPQVKDVMLGAKGVIANMKAGTCVIDTSTSAVDLVKQLFNEGLSTHVDFLEAPVTNAVDMAVLGRLSIFVGGSEK